MGNLKSDVSPALHRLRQRLGIYRSTLIDCFQPVGDILRQIVSVDPQILGGYPGVLTHIASRILNGAGPIPAPDMIITGGESLTPHRRSRIEAAFGAPVCDLYGAHEFNLLAWQCRDTGYYHICDDNVILEVLKDGRPVCAGESGEIVATSLHAHAMPFIRYKLGDLAVRAPDRCPCGLPYSTFKTIEGRVKDYYTLPGGRTIHPNRY